MAHIYVVEDNESIREAVTGYLQLADHEVSGFGELAGVKEALEVRIPDLILLDVMLPDGDGFIFAKELLSRESIPLIFMSARESESDRITGFEIGADDYIVKPFSVKEVVARVKAALRRTTALEQDIEVLRFGENEADFQGRSLRVGGGEREVPPRAIGLPL